MQPLLSVQPPLCFIEFEVMHFSQEREQVKRDKEDERKKRENLGNNGGFQNYSLCSDPSTMRPCLGEMVFTTRAQELGSLAGPGIYGNYVDSTQGDGKSRVDTPAFIPYIISPTKKGEKNNNNKDLPCFVWQIPSVVQSNSPWRLSLTTTRPLEYSWGI